MLNIFKLIYIIIDQKYEEGENSDSQNIIQYLVGDLFKKLRVENLSILIFLYFVESLFLNYITHNLKISQQQYDAMCDLIKEHPNLLSPTDLLKMNRCLSYMSFFLKEIYDYSSAKLSDGTPAFKIKNMKSEITQLREKIFMLKKMQALSP